jgi:hypothetical protein
VRIRLSGNGAKWDWGQVRIRLSGNGAKWVLDHVPAPAPWLSVADGLVFLDLQLYRGGSSPRLLACAAAAQRLRALGQEPTIKITEAAGTPGNVASPSTSARPRLHVRSGPAARLTACVFVARAK